MEIIIQENAEQASLLAAKYIKKQIQFNANSVLGLATGSTPVKMYKELIRMHKDEDLDFSGCTTFNLDEYIGLQEDHPNSYNYFMMDQLIKHINLPISRFMIPNGMVKDVPAFCSEYEAKITKCGGIDIQVLGIGTDGHLGFNEPTSSFASRTRIKTLDEQTKQDNQRFFEEGEEVPSHVITMGLGTILDSRMCLLLAFGKGKAQAVKEMVEGPLSAINPSSCLQLHPNVKILLDEESASLLDKKDYYKWVFNNKPDWQRI